MSILRMPAVKAETGHRSHASIYTAVRAGLFTKPVPIGARAVGWPDGEVQAVCAARIAGKSEEEIRALVNHLHAKRTERFAVLLSQPDGIAIVATASGSTSQLESNAPSLIAESVQRRQPGTGAA